LWAGKNGIGLRANRTAAPTSNCGNRVGLFRTPVTRLNAPGEIMSSPIAMIPLDRGAKLSLNAIQHQFVSNWPRLPRPVHLGRAESKVSFNVGGSTVFFELAGGPIPDNEWRAACARSWLWPAASEVLADHRGHVTVSLASHESAVNQTKFLSLAATSLLLSCPQALGVYWPAGGLVTSAEMFEAFCLQMLPDSLPLYIWVDFQIEEHSAGKTFGHTTGLAQFGLMEIETVTSHEDPKALRERLFGLAVYLIDHGTVIKNGDIIDEGEQGRIKVVYSDSSFGKLKRVMRLDYETAQGAIRKR
jgi:hypothetical protein